MKSDEEVIIDIMRNPEPRKRVSVIRTQMVKERTMLYGTRRFKTSAEAADAVQEIYKYADREMVVVMALDSKQAPLSIEIVSVGSINASIIDMRSVFKNAILSNAANIICFHNHPSGVCDASQDDIAATNRMVEVGRLLGIRLIDHIILGDDGAYLSLKEEGYIS